MPQPFNNAVMTNGGARLLTKAQAGGAVIMFTRMAVGDGVYAEEEKGLSALQGRDGLKSLKNSYRLSSKEVQSEHCVKVTALIANQDPASGECLVHNGYFINEIGLYAKEQDGGDDTEVLYSIAVTSGENGDFMPPFNGFSAAQIIQEYYVTVSNSAQVTVQTAGAPALAQDLEALKKYVQESVNRIDSTLQQMAGILYGYCYNSFEKKITSFLPHQVQDGRLVFPEGAAYLDGGMVVLRGGAAAGWPAAPEGGAGTGSIQEIAAEAAKIVEGSMEQIDAAQAKELITGSRPSGPYNGREK